MKNPLSALVILSTLAGTAGCTKRVYGGSWSGTCSVVARGMYAPNLSGTPVPCIVTVTHEKTSAADLVLSIPSAGVHCWGRGPIDLLIGVNYNDPPRSFRGIKTRFQAPAEGEPAAFLCDTIGGQQVADCLVSDPQHPNLNSVEFGLNIAQPADARFRLGIANTPNPACGPLGQMSDFMIHSENLRRSP